MKNKINNSEIKNYSIGMDVLEQAGIEAVKHLCEKGNIVYLDLPEIEKESINEKNKYSINLENLIEYLNKVGEFSIKNEDTYLMPTGGKLTWKKFDEGEKKIIITRDESLKSKLKRNGKIEGLDYQHPTFLRYGPETLEKGVIKINFNDNLNKISLDNVLEQLGVVFNNQIILVNNSIPFLIKQELRSNQRGDRFYVNENREVTLNKINLVKINSPFPEINIESIEQKLLFRQLMDKEIPLNIVGGGSGSGKTLLPYIAAVKLILGNEKLRKSKKIYDGIVLIKSEQLVGGKDNYGYTPGSIIEKAEKFMKSYMDCHRDSGIEDEISFLNMLRHPKFDIYKMGIRDDGVNIFGEYLPARWPAIEYEFLQTAIGRTFKNKVVIMDEAQNYEPYHMKQLLERLGDGCKVIIVGDPTEQIHNPKLSKDFNGLVWATNVHIGSNPLSSVNMLYENRRSQAAEHTRNAFAPRSR